MGRSQKNTMGVRASLPLISLQDFFYPNSVGNTLQAEQL